MGAKRFIGSVADVPTTDTSLDEHRSAVSEAEIVKSNWSNAARRMTKYQFGLMLALVGSTVTVSPAQADLDEKSKVIAE